MDKHNVPNETKNPLNNSLSVSTKRITPVIPKTRISGVIDLLILSNRLALALGLRSVGLCVLICCYECFVVEGIGLTCWAMYRRIGYKSNMVNHMKRILREMEVKGLLQVMTTKPYKTYIPTQYTMDKVTELMSVTRVCTIKNR